MLVFFLGGGGSRTGGCFLVNGEDSNLNIHVGFCLIILPNLTAKMTWNNPWNLRLFSVEIEHLVTSTPGVQLCFEDFWSWYCTLLGVPIWQESLRGLWCMPSLSSQSESAWRRIRPNKRRRQKKAPIGYIGYMYRKQHSPQTITVWWVFVNGLHVDVLNGQGYAMRLVETTTQKHSRRDNSAVLPVDFTDLSIKTKTQWQSWDFEK